MASNAEHTPGPWVASLSENTRSVSRVSCDGQLGGNGSIGRAKVPEGHVRTPDGVDRKVLGTLQITADGCVIGEGADLFCWWQPQYTDDGPILEHRHGPSGVIDPKGCYSTREAAQSAREVQP